MTKINNNKAGFSLVELMVVVAIIGILASIAVPNFLKFQAKAKQSSAKVELSGLFGAEKTFFSEYNTYHANLSLIGFIPDGIPLTAANCPNIAAGTPWNVRNYRVGFEFSTIALGAPAGITAACPAAAVGNGATFFDRGPTGATGSAAALASNPAFVAGALANSSDVATTNTFQATANGVVGNNPARQDLWTITQDKILTNTQQGI